MRKVNVSNSLRKLFSIIMVSIFIIAAMPVDYISQFRMVLKAIHISLQILKSFKMV
jgi:hypothetical protein